jgi:nucleoside-diphosphate-sugar epimerase
MRVFVAGATGAIGEPLIAELLRQGHSVVGMTTSEAGAKKLAAQGVEAAFANFVGAPEPPHSSEEEVEAVAGEDVVYYATRLNGASNAKAKRVLGWYPRRLEWLNSK